jgi:hypothetical protein
VAGPSLGNQRDGTSPPTTVTSPLFPSLAGYEIDANRELIGLGAGQRRRRAVERDGRAACRRPP